MGKLFGTDGIRGKANVYPITPEVALKLGKAIAVVFGAAGQGQTRAIIGKDTRLSGYMLETALTSGLVSMGMDVHLVGPMPTPAVAHLTKSMIAEVGLMITASHNPSEDNGIKIFDGNGFKLPDEVEEKIENLLLSDDDIVPSVPANTGKAFSIADAGGRYIEYVKGSIDNKSLRGMKIVLDCAHGAAYDLSPQVFRELGADVISINTNPDGLNINDGCGALYPHKMAPLVIENKADCGIAFDGDADRVIFCDGEGNVVDGDRIIAMCALDLKERGRLRNNTVAITVMTNLGFHKAMEANDINVVTTAVGDRHIIEAMRTNDYVIGGEQSGHIIFKDFATTGDGTIGALMVLALMKRTGKTVKELAQCMDVFPQKLTNLPVNEKPPIESISAIQDVIKVCEDTLYDTGRCMMRYSGTENKLRILLEAESAEDVDTWTARFVAAVQQELGS
ncbi:MAG: phosphoglucosamine mutase [Lentisphaeraceae bacterium]|nr:phosphoglucosamine mutase [Lentisphaeraceae bacterium]